MYLMTSFPYAYVLLVINTPIPILRPACFSLPNEIKHPANGPTANINVTVLLIENQCFNFKL